MSLGSFSTYAKANLKVHLYKNEQGLTQFNLTVSPNSAYPTLFVLTPVLFIYILFAFPSDLRGIIFYITMTNIEQHVTSRELSERLRDLGVPQQSLCTETFKTSLYLQFILLNLSSSNLFGISFIPLVARIEKEIAS